LDKEIQRRIAQKTLVEMGPDGEHEFLWRHQQLGRELAQVNDKYGFFYDTRTGKTPMSLQIMLDDVKANPDHKWLVLCPLILIENAWLPDAKDMFPELKIISLHASLKDKRLALFKQKANVYVLNIESFASYRDEVEKLGIHGCIVDESSTMKSNSSKFGKEAVDYAWTLKRWYLLSGSPAPNGEWEYYRQLQSIDFYGVHESFNQFKLYFFDNTSRNPQYEKLRVKSDRYAELLALLQQYSLYVDKEDVLDTPGRDFIEVPLKLPPSLRENYDQLRNEMFLEIGENISITSPSAAATLNKLNQVSSGFAIDTAAMKFNKMVREHSKHGGELAFEPFKQEDHLLSEYRFDALEELLAKHPGEQIIIWANYRKEFEVIQQRLGASCALIYGATNIQDKNNSIRAFKEGRLQYLVANPASADKGLTLTNSHICIYFSMNYSYELWKQSKERIYGSIIKQPKRCIYYIMIATGTVDRAIYTTVENKGDMSMAILDHLKGGL
jgi:SNF2 family DNA or RNA helicase